MCANLAYPQIFFGLETMVDGNEAMRSHAQLYPPGSAGS